LPRPVDQMTLQPARSQSLREGRFSEQGNYYLLTTTTLARQPFFVDRGAAEEVLSALRWLDEKGRVDLLAAVVMPDHVHAVVVLKQGDLAEVMHSLKSFTANRINTLLGRSGQVWQHAYHEHAIRSEQAMVAAVKYCLHNPVRAGLADNFRAYPHWYCAYEV
jgi:REP-associated tyrosine transposase